MSKRRRIARAAPVAVAAVAGSDPWPVPDVILRDIVGRLDLRSVLRWRACCRAWARRPWSWYRLPVCTIPIPRSLPNFALQLQSLPSLGDLWAHTHTLTLENTWAGMSLLLAHMPRLTTLSIPCAMHRPVGIERIGYVHEAPLDHDLAAVVTHPTLTALSVGYGTMLSDATRAAFEWRWAMGTAIAPLRVLEMPNASLFRDILMPESLERVHLRIELTPSSWDLLIDCCPRLVDLTLRINSYATAMTAAAWRADSVVAGRRRPGAAAHAWTHVDIDESDVGGATRATGPNVKRFQAALKVFLQPSIRSFRWGSGIDRACVTHAPFWLTSLPVLPHLTHWDADVHIHTTGSETLDQLRAHWQSHLPALHKDPGVLV